MVVHPNVLKAEDEVDFSLTERKHVRAMKCEIDFLANVANYPLLSMPGAVLSNAIRRFV